MLELKIYAARNGISWGDYIRMTPRDVFIFAQSNVWREDSRFIWAANIAVGAAGNIVKTIGAALSKHRTQINFNNAHDLYPNYKRWEGD